MISVQMKYLYYAKVIEPTHKDIVSSMIAIDIQYDKIFGSGCNFHCNSKASER